MIAYGADMPVSATDKLIADAEQIYVVTIEMLDGNASPMGMSTNTLVGKVDRVLKGKAKNGQSILVKWTLPDVSQATAEQKRRKEKVGENFIVFLKVDGSVSDANQRPTFVLSDGWLGLQPDNANFSEYITTRVAVVQTQK